MKQIEKIAESENFSAIGLGKLSELNEFVLELNPAVKIPGKVFGGAALQATGAEFSFQSYAPGTETGFLHTHKTHEELYFFLSGEGEFQVDGKIFPIGEGSVVRVAPAGRRSVRNTAQNEKAASKRKIAVSPYNGSGLPDDLQAAPPIRLSGRNLTEIRRQRLRYISS